MLSIEGGRVQASFSVQLAADHIAEAAMRGLIAWGELVLTESNSRVPHDSGDLERSGAVVPDRPNVAVHVTYDTPYAVRQHEDMGFRHEPGRGAKYLEGAVNNTRQDGLALVAAEIRRATMGTGGAS